METLIRFSSTLSNQIKELGVNISARESKTRTAHDSSIDKTSGKSFASRVLSEATPGQVLFDTSGNFFDFIQQVEDATLYHLLENFREEDLPHVSSVFMTRAAQFDDTDSMCYVYSASQLGVIRRSIRLIANHDFCNLSEHLDAIFLAISSCDELKTVVATGPLIRGSARSFCEKEISKRRLQFLAQCDDPLSAVLYMKMPSLDANNLAILVGKIKMKPSTVSVKVDKSGSEQVHGLYKLSTFTSADPAATTENSDCPVYCSPDGYLIVRHQRRIYLGDKPILSDPQTSDAPICGDGKDLIVDDVVESVLYRWVITNHALGTNYYTCSTTDPSPLPPRLGWRSCGALCAGKLPGPQLSVVVADEESSDDSDSDVSDSAGEVFPEIIPDGTMHSKLNNPKRKKKAKKIGAERQLVLSPSSFSMCAVDSPSDFEYIPCNSDVKDIPNAFRKRRDSGKAITRVTVRPIAAGPAYPPVVNKSPSESHRDQEGCTKSVTGDIKYFTESLKNICVQHDSNDVGEDRSLSLLERLKAEEADQRGKSEEIMKRMAWLTEARNTDELLTGFPSPCSSPRMSDEVYRVDEEMEVFAAQWDLKKVVARTSAPTTMVKSICSLATKTFKAAVTVTPRAADDVTIEKTQKSPAKKAVRKISSMPSIAAEEVPLERSHRRTQSQSIFQWPVGVSAFLSNTPLIEDNYFNSRTYSTLQSSSIWMESSRTRGGHRKRPNPNPNPRTPPPAQDPTQTTQTISPTSNHPPSNPERIMNSKDTVAEEKSGSIGMADLLELTTPLDSLCHNYSIVDVLGVQMRAVGTTTCNNNGGSSSSSSTLTQGNDRAHYVIRVSLRDSGCAVLTTTKKHHTASSSSSSSMTGNCKEHFLPLSSSSIPAKENTFSESENSGDGNAAATEHSELDQNACTTAGGGAPSSTQSPALIDSQSSKRSNTSPRHQTFQGLRSQHSYSRRVCTVRKDLAFLSLFHAELSDLLMAHPHHEIIPPPFPDPFSIAALEEGLNACSSSQTGRFSRQVRQVKKEDSFAYSSSLRAQNQGLKDGLEIPGLDQALSDIQDYLRAVFAIVEMLDDNAFTFESCEGVGNREEEEATADSKLLSNLGSLIGTLLSSVEHEEKGIQNTIFHPSGEQCLSTPTSPSTSIAIPYTPSLGMKRSSKETTEPTNVIADKGNVRSRACWKPFVPSGLELKLNLSDDQGGRLSMRSDEELLRSQGSRCVGCGESISAHWGFLGLDRNYQPCRFYGGLFCRKWCHANERRQIPHRLLLHWDHTAHRVSKQAARFLDTLWSQPVLLLNSANPLLYEGVPALRLARNMRGRTVQLIKCMLKSSSGVERQEVRDTIVNVLGAQQAHLCLSKELYSIADLVGVQTGDVLASLETLIGQLRDKDRTLVLT